MSSLMFCLQRGCSSKHIFKIMSDVHISWPRISLEKLKLIKQGSPDFLFYCLLNSVLVNKACGFQVKFLKIYFCMSVQGKSKSS